MKIAVLDFETDPFAHGQTVAPFAAGFYDGDTYRDWWGDGCVADLCAYIEALPEPHIIYAHNGGRFDFLFMLDWLSPDIFVIGSRIVKGHIGAHELRDSYSILPIALDKYQKTKINYDKFTKANRVENKTEIQAYLADDCRFLYELVSAFIDEFETPLTIGSTSMRFFRDMHPFKSLNENDDAIIRTFYFGGRVQTIRKGEIHGDFKVLDVNSMYPYVMRDFKHPIGDSFVIGSAIKDETFFARIVADSKGALPIKTKFGLEFPHGIHEFDATIHEIKAGLRTDRLKILNTIMTLDFEEYGTFEKFVVEFYAKRMHARAIKDKLHDLFYKLIMNSAYGKCGQNPRDFKEFQLTDVIPGPEWEMTEHFGGHAIWARPSQKRMNFYNVAIAASITGAARSVLLEGLDQAINPVYCDTDSIICEDYNGRLHNDELGAWKNEAQGDTVYIAGKKLYAVYSGGRCIKKATKGARLTADEIVNAARGETVLYCQDAPSINLVGEQRFLKREIRITGNECHF